MIRSLRRALLFAWFVLPAAAVPAQNPAGAKAPDEKAFLEAAAKRLDAYGTLCFKTGFPRKARAMWQLVLAEYEADDAVAREALGFTKVGSVWQARPDFIYPETDTPNAVAASMLQKKWEALARELGDGHRELAQQLEAAGNQARAQYHFDRALRLVPGDGKSAGALGRKNFEGLVGTEAEINLVKRSRTMDRAVARVIEMPVKTEPASGEPPAAIKAGNVAVTGVKSEHFTVWGDLETGVLQQLAAYAERGLMFCDEAFAGYQGWPPKPLPGGHFVYYQKHETWVSVVKANQGRIGASEVEFLVNNAKANQIGAGQDRVRFCGAEAFDGMRDFAVRQVVQEYSGFGTDGMREGIGHAVVGMFFGRNLWFLVGQQKQEGTVTGRNDNKLLMPDEEVWQELAVELAWQRTGTPPAQLPLLKAASFPNDGRILAWSFCDYLLRLDPTLLRALDATSAKARNEGDVKAAFQQATGRSLQELEDGWRHYWTDESPLRRAITQKATPLEAASKDAPRWLEEFNKLRALVKAPELGWSASLSTACRQHVEYLKTNKGERGPEHEHVQEPGKPGYTNSGRTFAPQALVSTRNPDAKKAMADWLHLPGYRDAIVNRAIDCVGLYVDGAIAVFDGDRGLGAKLQSQTVHFPMANLVGNKFKDPLPASVDVAELGPDVEALLKQNGRGRQKSIGYPVSLHGYAGDLKDVTCQMTMGGQEVPGILVNTTAGRCRCSSARGMWVYWPWEPLKRGNEVKVVWNWRDSGGAKEVTFVTQ
jgi:uncharacterized protein YkwD